MIKLKEILFLAILMVLAACDKPNEMAEAETPPTNPNEKEILMIGTFHFHNPGADVTKTKSFDILNTKSQEELELISSKIKTYNPTKIFVEWPHNQQNELDSLYNLYLNNAYPSDSTVSDFYRKNEIFQLAFRTAKKLQLKRVHAIDYNETDFPYDSVMTILAKYKQKKLQAKIDNLIKDFTTGFDEKISSGSSLEDLLYYLNSEAIRNKDISFYTELVTQTGNKENFIGAYLASEWYRRNIYMWSLLQKGVDDSDKKVMVLLGSSHIAVLDQMLGANPNWKTVELEEVLK